jgi:hypothetical protein
LLCEILSSTVSKLNFATLRDRALEVAACDSSMRSLKQNVNNLWTASICESALQFH